ncbi:MAG TPA: cupin domain-containing protein [Solirubrobacteraceae bacterium]|nr:cupin domain-containing protein [Solirubrobacteraceae bacterium]
MFAFHHFHSTSHEVLGVVAGRATLELGGAQGQAFEVARGDVLVLPAGTGHRRAVSDREFTVVGAYPAGQEDYDLLRGDDLAEVARARERIATLGAPPHDPVGANGVASWR